MKSPDLIFPHSVPNAIDVIDCLRAAHPASSSRRHLGEGSVASLEIFQRNLLCMSGLGVSDTFAPIREGLGSILTVPDPSSPHIILRVRAMSECGRNGMLGQSVLLSMDESDSDDVDPPFLPGGALLEADEGDDENSDGGWLSFTRACAQVWHNALLGTFPVSAMSEPDHGR